MEPTEMPLQRFVKKDTRTKYQRAASVSNGSQYLARRMSSVVAKDEASTESEDEAPELVGLERPPEQAKAPDETKIPVTILCGFLGSGKSSLLRAVPKSHIFLKKLAILSL